MPHLLHLHVARPHLHVCLLPQLLCIFPISIPYRAPLVRLLSRASPVFPPLACVAGFSSSLLPSPGHLLYFSHRRSTFTFSPSYCLPLSVALLCWGVCFISCSFYVAKGSCPMDLCEYCLCCVSFLLFLLFLVVLVLHAYFSALDLFLAPFLGAILSATFSFSISSSFLPTTIVFFVSCSSRSTVLKLMRVCLFARPISFSFGFHLYLLVLLFLLACLVRCVRCVCVSVCVCVCFSSVIPFFIAVSLFHA